MRLIFGIVASALVVLTLLIVLITFGVRSLFDGSAPLLLSESKSPANLGSVELVTDNRSFAGSDAWVYIRDPDYAGGHPQLIGGGYASDGAEKMRRAIWSKDGSVVAVRADVGESAGKHFAGSYQSFFVAAYDFKANRVIVVTSPTRSKSEAIARLLRQRGGEGKAIFRTPYDASGEPMSRRQLEEYKELQEYNR